MYLRKSCDYLYYFRINHAVNTKREQPSISKPKKTRPSTYRSRKSPSRDAVGKSSSSEPKEKEKPKPKSPNTKSVKDTSKKEALKPMKKRCDISRKTIWKYRRTRLYGNL